MEDKNEPIVSIAGLTDSKRNRPIFSDDDVLFIQKPFWPEVFRIIPSLWVHVNAVDIHDDIQIHFGVSIGNHYVKTPTGIYLHSSVRNFKRAI